MIECMGIDDCRKGQNDRNDNGRMYDSVQDMDTDRVATFRWVMEDVGGCDSG